jgi:hypothetical protein
MDRRDHLCVDLFCFNCFSDTSPMMIEVLVADVFVIDFEALVGSAAEAARRRLTEIARLAAQADRFMAFDYSFLYDPVRHLMAIGYNASDHRCDSGYYDLLASEARLCTFLGVAQGRLPQQSWFALGRLLTHAAGEPILLSWSGSMFEYLMPMLVMPSFDNTLLDQTAHAAVKRQIEYGRQRGVPWGISESGYNTVDAAFNYQYRAFGVPGLGLQRGLAEDLVIAPYATALAFSINRPSPSMSWWGTMRRRRSRGFAPIACRQ